MSRDMAKMLAFLASSAIGCLDEPPIYGPLRLLEALEKLIQYALEHEANAAPDLKKIAERIAAEKVLCMTDPEKFEELLHWVGSEMVSVI